MVFYVYKKYELYTLCQLVGEMDTMQNSIKDLEKYMEDFWHILDDQKYLLKNPFKH